MRAFVSFLGVFSSADGSNQARERRNPDEARQPPTLFERTLLIPTQKQVLQHTVAFGKLFIEQVPCNEEARGHRWGSVGGGVR